MNSSIDEISCCNCVTCQVYIKRIEMRLNILEDTLRNFHTVYRSQDSSYAVFCKFPLNEEEDVSRETY